MISNKLNDILNTSNQNDTSYIICDFIKNNISNINNMTIDTIADSCYVSKSYISKFVKKLGYSNFGEFKDECRLYTDSLNDKKILFKKDCSLQKNIANFSNNMIYSINNLVKSIDYKLLNDLIIDIHNCSCLFLFGQGDIRSLCNTIQTELDRLNKPVLISDVDFSKTYNFDKNALLIILSVNGKSFYDRRLINKMLHQNINTWLITCNDKLKFPKKKFLVPTINSDMNEFTVRYAIDIIIAELYKLN